MYVIKYVIIHITTLFVLKLKNITRLLDILITINYILNTISLLIRQEVSQFI